jgi:hypothetical protein
MIRRNWRRLRFLRGNERKSVLKIELSPGFIL